MPFPWKKVKSTRISQLVNDHLHNSQKRRDGSSLVVETGFPTSLVDLFIKNREKLKKPSKKKRQSPPISPITDSNDPVITRSSVSLPSPLSSASSMISPSIEGSATPPTHCPLRCPSPLRSPSVFPLPSRGVNEILVVGSSDGSAFVGAERGVDASRVLFVVLKMFLVVILALGTKRLTVGITISAFLLLFLEYVGKHARELLKPCSAAKGVIKSVIQRVWRLLRFKEVKFDEKVLMQELQQGHSLDTSESRLANQEIQIVEPEGYLLARVEEIQPENEIMDVSCVKEELVYQEIESEEVVMEKEESICEVAELKRKSRKAKIKSKMKKLVPKKLRTSRKEHDPQRLEIVQEDIVFLCHEQEADQCKDEGESETATTRLSSISSDRYKEEDGLISMCAFGGLSEVNEEADTKTYEKGQEIGAGLTWRHLVLCLVVLIGLIGGRVFALLLTLSWFLVLKLGETLPRYKKVPIIRSFHDKSCSVLYALVCKSP